MSPIAIEAPNDSSAASKPIVQAVLDASVPSNRSNRSNISNRSPLLEAESPSTPAASFKVIDDTLRWVTVCKHSDLIPGRGVAALINNHQYALFLTNQGELFAVDNRDPFCDANVMARGIIGDRNGEPKVASPMLKQTFSLHTGICFEDANTSINTHQIRSTPTQTIEIQVTKAPSPSPSLG